MQKLQLNRYAMPINKLSHREAAGCSILNSRGSMRTNWAISRSMIIVFDAAAGCIQLASKRSQRLHIAQESDYVNLKLHSKQD